MSAERPLPQLLLVEPDFLLRRIVAGVARDLRLAQVQEATSPQHAAQELAVKNFNAMLIALDPNGEALKLLDRMRQSHGNSPNATPVAVTTEHCDAELAQQLRELHVRRVLLKPFKVKGVIETIAGLCATASQEA